MKLNATALHIILVALLPFVLAGGYEGGPMVSIDKANVEQFISGLEDVMSVVPESAQDNAQFLLDEAREFTESSGSEKLISIFGVTKAIPEDERKMYIDALKTVPFEKSKPYLGKSGIKQDLKHIKHTYLKWPKWPFKHDH